MKHILEKIHQPYDRDAHPSATAACGETSEDMAELLVFPFIPLAGTEAAGEICADCWDAFQVEIAKARRPR